MARAATEVQDNISWAGPGDGSHEGETVFEEPLRVTVLFRRAR